MIMDQMVKTERTKPISSVHFGNELKNFPGDYCAARSSQQFYCCCAIVDATIYTIIALVYKMYYIFQNNCTKFPSKMKCSNNNSYHIIKLFMLYRNIIMYNLGTLLINIPVYVKIF